MPICFLSAPLRTSKQTEFTRYMSASLVLFALATPAFAQSLRFGVKGGVPMTQYFEAGPTGGRNFRGEYSSATRRYTVGPSIEWRIKYGFGFELDALYKRMGYVSTVTYGPAPTGVIRREVIDVKGNSWEFPLMMKYRLGQPIAVYGAAGFVLRHIGPVRGRGVSTVVATPISMTPVSTPIETTGPSDLRKRTWPGLTVAYGLEFGIGRLRLLPEVRYTRWTSNISERGPLRFEPNQAEFLLGFLF